MGNRVLRWIYLLDMASLVVAVAVASLFVFATALPWTTSTPGPIWPFLAMMFAGGTVGSYMSARAWGKTAPRPNYGRAVAIVGDPAYPTLTNRREDG